MHSAFINPTAFLPTYNLQGNQTICILVTAFLCLSFISTFYFLSDGKMTCPSMISIGTLGWKTFLT